MIEAGIPFTVTDPDHERGPGFQGFFRPTG
jgi:hypothetical protein